MKKFNHLEFENLPKFMQKEILEVNEFLNMISGINPELLGSIEDDQIASGQKHNRNYDE